MTTANTAVNEDNNNIIRQPKTESDQFVLCERWGNYVKLLPPDVKTRDRAIPLKLDPIEFWNNNKNDVDKLEPLPVFMFKNFRRANI